MIHERPSPNTPATAGVCSLVMPSLHPGSDRREAVFPEGTPIASIVDTVLPGLPRERHSAVRVIVVGPSGADVVPQEAWASVRPKVGTRVLVRVVPGNGLLRGVLQIVAMIAAVALAGVLGPMLAGVWGLSAATWQGIVTAGVALAGNLLINALIPVRKPEKEAKTFQIGGMRNQANPDGPIPNPFGRMRMAPVYWGLPYTEVVGDIQYLRVLFVWGYGRLKISDLKIGETPLSEFDEVEIETREGVDDDDPVTLYPQQVLEEALSVELTRAWERDDAGEYVSGGTTIEKPVVRVTASDASEAGVILATERWRSGSGSGPSARRPGRWSGHSRSRRPRASRCSALTVGRCRAAVPTRSSSPGSPTNRRSPPRRTGSCGRRFRASGRSTPSTSTNRSPSARFGLRRRIN
jgi:hypothetical protein